MNAISYYEKRTIGRQTNREVTWYGQQVSFYEGSIAELREKIPYFERGPFALEDRVGNVYFDLIVRKPLSKDKPRAKIPVAIVSKNYALIQHHEILDSLKSALETIGFDPQSLHTELRLSYYGERMHFILTLPDYDFEPGDGYPIVLRVNCLNSVDRSMALEIKLSWLRLVCSNGMMYGVGDTKLRRIHLKSLSSEDIAKYLESQLEKLPDEQSLYKQWFKAKLSISQIECWADEQLAKSWGNYVAARACHIARTGYDGKVVNPSRQSFQLTLFDKGRVKPHELLVEDEIQVPGAHAPVTNAFHVSQVLSWLAKERGTIQAQLEWMMQIPNLMAVLLNSL